MEPHTVKLVDKQNNEKIVTAGKILLAMGGRPIILDIEGAKEHAITSDDLFWLP